MPRRIEGVQNTRFVLERSFGTKLPLRNLGTKKVPKTLPREIVIEKKVKNEY